MDSVWESGDADCVSEADFETEWGEKVRERLPKRVGLGVVVRVGERVPLAGKLEVSEALVVGVRVSEREAQVAVDGVPVGVAVGVGQVGESDRVGVRERVRVAVGGVALCEGGDGDQVTDPVADVTEGAGREPVCVGEGVHEPVSVERVMSLADGVADSGLRVQLGGLIEGETLWLPVGLAEGKEGLGVGVWVLREGVAVCE